MNKVQAQHILESEADLRRSGVQQSFAGMNLVADAIDALCGVDAYCSGRLSPALSAYYADCRGYCRDLRINPSDLNMWQRCMDEMKKLEQVKDELQGNVVCMIHA